MKRLSGRTALLATTLLAIGSTAAVIDARSRGVQPPGRAGVDRAIDISAPGVVEGATEAIGLRAEARGAVAAVAVSVGDRVAAGQTLVRLDNRHALLGVESAQARLASALAERERLVNGARSYERDEARALLRATAARLSQAQTSLERLERLETQRAVEEQKVDDARSEVETLRAELAAAEARVASIEAPARDDEVRLADARVAAAQATFESARVALDKTILRAPVDAQVLDLNARPGELITPADSTPTVVLADTRRLRARAYVEELDAPRVTLGAPVEVTADGLPHAVFRGVIAELSPRMASKRLLSDRPNEVYDTKTREVLIDLEAPEGLLVGLRVDVLIAGGDSLGAGAE